MCGGVCSWKNRSGQPLRTQNSLVSMLQPQVFQLVRVGVGKLGWVYSFRWAGRPDMDGDWVRGTAGLGRPMGQQPRVSVCLSVFCSCLKPPVTRPTGLGAGKGVVVW